MHTALWSKVILRIPHHEISSLVSEVGDSGVDTP